MPSSAGGSGPSVADYPQPAAGGLAGDSLLPLFVGLPVPQEGPPPVARAVLTSNQNLAPEAPLVFLSVLRVLRLIGTLFLKPP